MADEAVAQARRHNVSVLDHAGESIVTLADLVTPLVSLLLYLCTDQPDIVDPRKPSRKPQPPAPTKTKQGPRLFPPSRVTTWQVGQTVSDDLDAVLPGGTWLYIDDRYRWISSSGIS
jgi:hypothetical protein